MGGRRLENIIGKKFGHLTAMSPVKRGRIVEWLCACDCGNTIYARTAYLKSGRVKSCGCAKNEGIENVTPTTKVKWKRNLEKARKIDTFEGMRMSRIRSIMNGTARRSISGVTGVTFDKTHNRWRASIGYKGKNIYLGVFESLSDAIAARKKAEQEYYAPLLKRYNKALPKIRAKVESELGTPNKAISSCENRHEIVKKWQEIHQEKATRGTNE